MSSNGSLPLPVQQTPPAPQPDQDSRHDRRDDGPVAGIGKIFGISVSRDQKPPTGDPRQRNPISTPSAIQLRRVHNGDDKQEKTAAPLLTPEKKTPREITKPYPIIGIRGWVHKYVLRHLFQWFGWSWLILAQSLKEQILREEEKLRRLCDTVQPIELHANQKGGSSKSTGAASSATVRGDVTRQMITVIDGNQAMGSSRSLLGIEPEQTVTVRTAVQIMGKKFDHQALIRHLGHHPRLTNVRCISSDDFEGRASHADLTAEEAGQLIYWSWHAGHSVIVDLGNDLEKPLTQAALNLAHVVKIDFVPWQANSDVDARDTLRTFRHSHPELMERAIIVINGYKGSRRHIDTVRAKYAKYFDNHPVEQVVVVPFDKVFGQPNLARGDSPVQPVQVVEPRKFARRTYLAYLQRENLSMEKASLAPTNPYHGATHATTMINSVSIPSHHTDTLVSTSF